MKKLERLLSYTWMWFVLLCVPISAFGANKVNLQLVWKNQFQFAGYYAAKELGYYDDAGLDVTIKEYEFGTDVTADVVSRKAHFGVGRSSIILESMEGKPIYLLSAIFQHSPFVLLAKKRKDLKAVSDLKGKRIMVTDDVVGMASLTAMLTVNGIKADDFTSQKHTFTVDDLISGNTDAIAAYVSNEPYQMEKRGVDYTIFAPKDHGFDFYGDILFTSQKLYKDNPQLVERFNQASLRGWAYAFSHIDGIVDIILKKYNTQNRGRDALRFEANKLKELAYDRDTPFGLITKSRVEQISHVYRLLGLSNKALQTNNLIFSSKDKAYPRLTPEEQSWLDEHHTVRARVGQAPPLHFFDGKFRGISVDYLNLIAKRAGFKIQYVTDIPWSNALANIKKHEVNDLLLTATVTPERQKFMAFTKDYLLMPWVIFTQKDRPVDTIDALINKTVSVEQNYVVHKKLVAEYPGIKLLIKGTSKEAIEAVATGQADAYIGNLTIGAYIIQQYNFNNLKVSAPTPFDNNNQAMAIRDDWPELAGIINKTFADITTEEHTAISKKWLSIDYEQGVDGSKIMGTASGSPVDTFKLTPEEQAWLDKHPKIRVNGDEWPPFAIDKGTGGFEGISVDIIKLAASRVGLEVEIVPGAWADLKEMLKKRELDVGISLVKTPEREKYLSFTDTYISMPNAIYTAKTTTDIQSFGDLAGKKVPIVKGFYLQEILADQYPDIEQVSVNSPLEGLQKVISGDADAYIGGLAVSQYLIQQNLISRLKIAGYWNKWPVDLRMGIRSDDKVLAGIIQKSLDTITEEQKARITSRYISVSDASTQRDKVLLTEQVDAWLKNHPVIRVHNEKDWPPFNFFEFGTPRGLSIDYMNLLAERLGIRIEYVTGSSWNEFLGLIQKKDLDVMLNIVKTEDRMKYLLYTEPYLRNPNVIISSQKHSYETTQALFGKTVAFPKGFFWEEVLTKSFPQIKRLPVKDTLASLKAVTFGKADAALGEEAVVNTLISKNMLTGLRVSGEVNIGNPDLVNLRIGVRDDWPLLHSALMKAMADIQPQEMNQIQQKWLQVDTVTSAPETDTPVSYSRLVIYGVIVFLVVGLLAFILIRLLRRENIAVSFGSPWFRWLVLAGLSVFVLIVAFLGWYNLERNKTQHLQDLDENLRGFLSVGQDRLDLWLEEKISYMARLGRDPELVAITKRLLQVDRGKDILLKSDELRDARSFFKESKDIFSNIGFFIIDPDHVSIGSMRDTNIGSRNLISEQHPELLQRAFKGEVGFVPPITSDVLLGNSTQSDKAKKPPTMFFIGPVMERNGRVVAVMTLRVDPWKDFARTMKSFESAGTGETYAFDRNGRMLSVSRFEDQLRRIGLLAANQSSALNIEIRDPGGNMVEGHRPNIERSKQPLTYMVSRAVALRQKMEKAGIRHGLSPVGSDLDGYRDYRGVPVFGAWLWNADLDMGLAIEVDVDEALANYYRTRLMIFSILGFTLFLSVGAILFVLIIGERTSRALLRARDNLEEKVVERTSELTEKQGQLAEAEERSRLLLDSVGEGIFGVDLNGKVVFINSAANHLLGYEAEELIGLNVHEKIHHSHADSSPYPVEDCPMARAFTQGTTETISDEMLWRKDGNGFSVEYTATPVLRGKEITGAVVAFRDITERKQMEDVLAAESERLQNILDTSPVGVAFSTKGIIHFTNPRFLEMFDVKVGDPSPDLYVHPEERDQLVEKLSTDGRVDNYELQMYGRGKQVRDMLVTYMPINIDGEDGILGWLLDITDRKTAEKEIKEKYDELARFRKLAVGREHKMIELKKEINKHLEENGLSEKYKIH